MLRFFFCQKNGEKNSSFRNINQKHEVLICFEALVFLSDCKAIIFQVLLFLFKILIFLNSFCIMGIRGDRKKGSQLKRIDQTENRRQESSGGGPGHQF